MAKSTMYFLVSGIDYVYRFTGVTAIEYNFALNIDADLSQGGDIINEARRLPNQIRVSVVETDAQNRVGWSASMLSALDSIRRNRVMCTVVTDMGVWYNMFMAEITATEDQVNQYGWAGDIVFLQYIPKSEQYYKSDTDSEYSSTTSTRRTQNNSSTAANTGTKAGNSSVSGAAFSTLLTIAGIG